MGNYVKKTKDMRFQSQEALKTVQKVLDEAGAQLHNQLSRKHLLAHWELELVVQLALPHCILVGLLSVCLQQASQVDWQLQEA